MAGRLLVFFFQAEDGIRDLTVTGVQTCALPILFLFWWRPSPPLAAGHWPDRHRRSARARSFRVHRMTERSTTALRTRGMARGWRGSVARRRANRTSRGATTKKESGWIRDAAVSLLLDAE